MTTRYIFTCCGSVYTSKISVESVSKCPYCQCNNPTIKEDTQPYPVSFFSGDKQFEERPWGSFSVLLDEPNVKVKKIVVKPDGRLSLQLHKHRKEYWVIAQGIACMQLGNNEIVLYQGDKIHIEKYQVHRVENQSDEDLIIIEVQTGDCQENDIVRLEDDYGRQ
tara:strand:+ start:475 stop:966 length:492 start_codon:yes stop_codon:yes gene_type:complete